MPATVLLKLQQASQAQARTHASRWQSMSAAAGKQPLPRTYLSRPGARSGGGAVNEAMPALEPIMGMPCMQRCTPTAWPADGVKPPQWAEMMWDMVRPQGRQNYSLPGVYFSGRARYMNERWPRPAGGDTCRVCAVRISWGPVVTLRTSFSWLRQQQPATAVAHVSRRGHPVRLVCRRRVASS